MTKTKYNIRGSLTVKITAAVLFIAFAVICTAALFGAVYAMDSNIFYANGFEDSTLCYTSVQWEAAELFYDDNLIKFEPAKTRENLEKNGYLDPNNKNFFFYIEYFEQTEQADGSASLELIDVIKTAEISDQPNYIIHTHSVSSNDPYGSNEYGEPVDDLGNLVSITYRQVRVRAWLNPALPSSEGEIYEARRMYDFLDAYKYQIVTVLIISGVVTLALTVFLFFCAGRRRGEDGVHVAWFDKIPLDLLTAISATAVFLAVLLLAAVISYGLSYSVTAWVNFSLWHVAAAALGIAIAGITLAWLTTLAVRVKAPGKYSWYRNTIIFLVLRLAYRVIRKFFGGIARLIASLPLTWKPALIFCAAALLNFIFAVIGSSLNGDGPLLPLFLILLLDAVLLAGVTRLTLQLREIEKGGKAIASGNTDYVIDTSKMLWNIKQHGENLNSVNGAITLAVEERMKSERLKTELITNVSHDIKTPLTSIINYVDLLKSEILSENPDNTDISDGENIKTEKAIEYLDVIDRQSQRLKKLTEDLVEASKVTAGVITPEKSPTKVSELLEQVLGEYSDRFKAAGIEPVVNLKNRDAEILADGKLLWRVFDNLSQNILKYAMPGTRAYFDSYADGGRVYIILRNISAAPLNISADELMERFVRGDRSRHTEGSGLGLAISRSLVELNGGSFEICLDGDLFKAVITLPG